MKPIQIHKKALLIVGFLLIGISSFGQYVKIYGTVTDSATNQPIPFVNVAFKDKNVGTTTDVDGKYMLETQWGSKTLIFSSVGYHMKEVKISQKSNQQINIKLTPQVLMLEDFEVKSKKYQYRNKDNPAVILIRNVLANKDENRGKTYEYFEYDKYVKSEYDINNFSEGWLDKPGMRGFKVLNNYVDTSELNGKPYVPIFVHEKVSTVYQRNFGKDYQENVTGSRLSGIEDANLTSSIDQFMSKIGGDIDIYENKIILFDKSFTSPISSVGPTIYRYYITDSMLIEGVQYKQLSFMPRNHSMIAFTGFMWVGDSTMNYGVQSIELNLDKRMNINFMNDMRIVEEFAYDTLFGWHFVKEKMIVDVQPTSKSFGIFNTKTTYFTNFKINQPRPDEYYSSINDVVYNLKEEYSKEYWDSNRVEAFTAKDEAVYKLADTIINVPQFKIMDKMIHLGVTGYLPLKKIELGPLTSLMSYNTVEGVRLRAGFLTNQKFNKHWRFTTWVAYGLTDERLKYQGKVEYYFNTKPYRRLEVSYINNTFQPGFAIGNIPQDHFMLSFRRSPTTNMFYLKNFKVQYDHEWFVGLTNSFEVNLKVYEATRFNTMIHAVSYDTLPQLVDNSFTITTRFSKNEKIIRGDFRRYPVKTSAPIFTLGYTYSGTVFGSNYEYHKLLLRFEKRFMMGVFGYSDWVLEGNKIFGKVPYPLLIIHNGNESISYDKNSYNMMNFMEFASDQSVGLMGEHHFDGLIFGFFPVLKNTNIRTVVSGKMLWGSVTLKNKNFANDSNLILIPERLGSLSTKPYVEASIGIENIFKVIRVDLVKRFTYLDAENIGDFLGVKGLSPRIAYRIKF